MKCMKLRKLLSEQRGGVAIMVAVTAVVLLSFAALVIDLGYAWVVRNQLHNVADAATLAGTRCLGAIYAGGDHPRCSRGISYAEQQNYVLSPEDRALIVAEVQDAAQKNAAGGKSISINDADIRIGQWSLQNRILTVTDEQPDAVEVTARRDGTANAPITTFLANIMGINELSVTATSVRNGRQENPTAALTGVSQVGPGELDLPVGISTAWFTNQDGGFCGKAIQFSPTGTLAGCAGWNTFMEKTHSAKQLEDILNGLENGTYTSPAATAGETEFNFTGGDVASAFEDFEALYDANKDASGKWETFIVVYDYPDCSNPKNWISIVGFATIVITEVKGPPDRTIVGNVVCEAIQDARGGGAEYGTKGSIPGLVQ